MEVAEPSRSIWKLSMSSALSPAMALERSVSALPEDSSSASTSMTFSCITPSTTHSGWLLP